VKYIKPNGSISRNVNISPPGATSTVKTTGSGTVSRGWGNADVSTYDYGRHSIQFFWHGIQIGETQFEVY